MNYYYRVLIKYCVFFQRFQNIPDSGLSLFSLGDNQRLEFTKERSFQKKNKKPRHRPKKGFKKKVRNHASDREKNKALRKKVVNRAIDHEKNYKMF